MRLVENQTITSGSKLNSLNYNKNIRCTEYNDIQNLCTVLLMFGKKLFQQSYLRHRQEHPHD